MRKPRLVLTLIVAAVVVTAILAAVTANSAHSLPGFRTTCDGSGCHALTSAGTVTAIPSTTTPAAGASYNVAINIGLTSSGNTGYRITYPNTTAPTVDVQGASSASTSRTQAMTAPSAPGTYTYRVWVAKGAPSAGQTRSVTYTITVPNPAPAAPVLTSLSPVSGLAGSSVTINGTNLGSAGAVSFSGTAATTTSWTATRIVATVPAGISAGAKTVTVTPTGAAASNGLTYTVTTPAPAAPVLTSLSPVSGLAGSSVTINGTNLGSAGAVSFSGTAATTTSWTATRIVATVPAGISAGAKTVTVTPTGAAASNGLTYTVTTPAPAAPVLTSLSPVSGLAGSSVTINGTNLGSAGAVSFSGTAATTTSWTATRIVATVPAGISAGAKTVTVTPTGAAASNGLTYTVTTPAPAAPVLTSLSPVSGLAGSSVTINGTNLGSAGAVSFSGTAATTTSWTATRIVATVPAGISAGAKTVTVTPTGAAASNGLTYTVTTRAPDGTDKTPPTTVATGVTPNGWYNHNVTVRLTATDNAGGSGVASITYSVDGGAPVTVKGSTATVTIGADDDDDYDHDAYDHDGDDEDSRDGAHVVTYYATDVAGNTEAKQALKVNIDTQKPTTKAPCSAKAKRYHTATLKYQVNDATPNGGTAKVLIVIKSSRGDVVKMLDLGHKPVNTPLAASFNCSLRPGTYTFYVYATDTAGNRQANVAKNTLKVYSGS